MFQLRETLCSCPPGSITAAERQLRTRNNISLFQIKRPSFQTYNFLPAILEKIPQLVPLGCYKEKKFNRLLDIKFGDFRNSDNESDPCASVVKCAHLVRDMDYEYFAVQNFATCRTAVNIVNYYYAYGEATPENCVGGVGAKLTNFVYRATMVGDSLQTSSVRQL